MKKDIEFPTVEGVQIAVARKKNDVNEFDWYVYLLNRNNYELDNILITSKGYSSKDKQGEVQKTSILRHMILQLEAQSYAPIERIDPAVFHLCNEYWLSYYVDGKIYDKKFIFMPESIIEKNLSNIDMLEMEGVLHS